MVASLEQYNGREESKSFKSESTISESAELWKKGNDELKALNSQLKRVKKPGW